MQERLRLMSLSAHRLLREAEPHRQVGDRGPLGERRGIRTEGVNV